MNIAIISASTRINRMSHRVSEGLAQQLIEIGGHEVQILDLAAYNFPIMEETLKRHTNPPEGLVEFAAHIRQSDAVLMVSPEYNGAYTAALKNAIDYLSENEFTRKVVGVVSVTSGPMGGMRGAQLMQQLVLGIGGFPIPQLLLVGNVAQRFDENGALIDATFQKNILQFLSQFLWLGEAVAEKKAVVA